MKTNQYKIPLLYGFYGALLGFVFYLMLLFSGHSPWSSASWMGCWIPGVTAFFTIKKYQSEKLNSSFTFFETFRISFLAVAIQAFVYNTLSVSFDFLFKTNSLSIYKAEIMQYADQIKSFTGEEFYEQMMLELEKITISSLSVGDFTNKIIGGIIVSLILAGFLKKNISLANQ